MLEASTAEEALQKWREAVADGCPFRLVIMDEIFDLSETAMRGSTAIAAIREAEAQTKGDELPCAIVSSTGNVMPVTQASNVDAVWGKPLPNIVDGTMQRSLAALLGSGESFGALHVGCV